MMKYDLTTPCGLCPFRNDDKRLTVSADRLAEMASGEFCCHKTTEVNDESGVYDPKPESQHCAGALIFREKQNNPHQMMRICERLGMYDRRKLNMDAPVFGSLAEVRKADRKPRKRTTPQAEKRDGRTGCPNCGERNCPKAKDDQVDCWISLP